MKTYTLKKVMKFIINFSLILLVFMGLYFYKMRYEPYYPKSEAKVYLFGEYHGEKEYYDKEFELWKDKYDRGYRHLFLEVSNAHAEFLNLWLKSDGDEILNELNGDLRKYTVNSNDNTVEFYKKIKTYCKDTIVHGTDIEHLPPVGQRYLKYLESNNLKDSKSYKKTKKQLEQANYYYKNNRDEEYREKVMTENFIEEYKEIGEPKIMAIFGDAHCNYKRRNYKGGTKVMIKGLMDGLGDIIEYKSIKYLINN